MKVYKPCRVEGFSTRGSQGVSTASCVRASPRRRIAINLPRRAFESSPRHQARCWGSLTAHVVHRNCPRWKQCMMQSGCHPNRLMLLRMAWAQHCCSKFVQPHNIQVWSE